MNTAELRQVVVGIDTAISNTGIAVIDLASGKPVALFKPIPKKSTEEFSNQWDKVDLILSRFSDILSPCNSWSVKLVAFEDYVVGGNQRATTAVTAELIGALRWTCKKLNIPYCRVHPSKTLKYVVKARKVTKTEIIDYARLFLGLTKESLVSRGIAPSDESDIADALVIANIGRMLCNFMCSASAGVMSADGFRSYAKGFGWEERWIELFYYTGSGILEKPGLCWFPKGVDKWPPPIAPLP